MVPVSEKAVTVLYHLQGTSQQPQVTQQGKGTSLSEDAVISYISFARYQSTATSNSTRQWYPVSKEMLLSAIYHLQGTSQQLPVTQQGNGTQFLRRCCYQLYIIC